MLLPVIFEWTVIPLPLLCQALRNNSADPLVNTPRTAVVPMLCDCMFVYMPVVKVSRSFAPAKAMS